MKKTITLFIAMALVLGLSQCKKNVEQAAQDVASGTVTLTLNVGDNGDGSKYSVNTSTGAVTYSSGDVIYVASEGTYLGTMSYTGGGTFTGSINTPTVGSPIWFFFFGDKEPNESLTKGTSTSCTVTISDQTTSLPVISCAASNENYVDGNTTYSAKLLNKCALVKFSTNVNSVTIEVGGMKTVATVSFAGTVTPGTSGSVSFTTNSSGEGWAILLPQDAVNATVDAGAYSGTCNVPAITNNMFYTTGVSVTMKDLGISISSTQKVRFAPGNLQAVYASANTSTCTWQFASTQYSCIGNATANNAVGNNLVTTAGTVDLFGWVGANSSLAAYGVNNNGTATNYGNTTNESLKSDWSVVANAASLGGHSDWITLTSSQWKYILSDRTDASQKYGHGVVGTQNGLIILPDAFVLPDGLSFTSGNSAWTNSYTTAQWALMEENGAVFLPAAGRRSRATVSDAGSSGYYWSSTAHSSYADYAYRVYFYSGNLTPQRLNGRLIGLSVRLARVVE